MKVKFVVRLSKKTIVGSSNQKQAQSNSSSNKSVTIDELFQNLANGMLKGGVGGFLNTAKTATGIQAGGQFETRIGIAEVFLIKYYFNFKNPGLCGYRNGIRTTLVETEYSILVSPSARIGFKICKFDQLQ